MKAIGVLGAAALVAFSFSPVNTAGPYVDSRGTVYDELPLPGGDLTVEEFNARFAHEVFTGASGHPFQLDRELTPDELRRALVQKQLSNTLAPPAHRPGGGLRATVSTNHPCDEEFISSLGSGSATRNFVIDFVELADNSMFSNFGINLVPTTGQRWDSNDGADIVGLLDEAWAEHGLQGQDLMIACSNDPTPGGAIGVAYIGLPRQLVKKYQGLEENICEHETGHNYTLNHCCKACTMYAFLTVSYFGSWHNSSDSCSGQNHYSTMNNQKNRY